MPQTENEHYIDGRDLRPLFPVQQDRLMSVLTSVSFIFLSRQKSKTPCTVELKGALVSFLEKYNATHFDSALPDSLIQDHARFIMGRDLTNDNNIGPKHMDETVEQIKLNVK